MEAGKTIEVKCLDPIKSSILFTEKVGQEVIQSHPDIPKLAEDIAKECHGLPLALITIGRAMSTKHNIDDWKYTLNQLKNSQRIHDLGVKDEQLLQHLKISYDYLANDQLRECFLTTALWPENHMIGTNELIEFWMGIGLIDKFKSKHEVGHSLIGSLRAACLLEDLDEYRITNMSVKMHDVLRDLALWLANDCGRSKNKWIVNDGIQRPYAPKAEAKWRETKCISLMHNKMKKLPSDIPNCPSLLTLVLKGNDLSTESILNCFGKFQSLTHLDLSMNSLESFPESICDLTDLRYLNLSSNEITDLPMKLGNLKVLRYLILRYNKITNIPRGVFAELAELLVLDMFQAINTHWYPSVDIEELKSIENKLLCFGTTVKTEEELRKLMLLSELPIGDLCVEGLHSTTFNFMSMIRNAHQLQVLCIERSDGGFSEIVFDKNETDQGMASLNLEHLELLYLYKLKRISLAPEISFDKLRSVKIWYCRLIENITWVIYLPFLKSLGIRRCDSMRIAVNNDVDSFPSLEMLSIAACFKMKKISNHSIAFPQLKHVNILLCPLLKELPLEVNTTPKLRKIMGQKEWWEKVEWLDNYSKSHFNQFFTNRRC